MGSGSSNNPFALSRNPQSSTSSSAQDHNYRDRSPISGADQYSNKSQRNSYQQAGGNTNASGSSAGQSGSGGWDRPKDSIWERMAERLGGHGERPPTAKPRQYLPDNLKEDYEKSNWKGGN